MNYKKFHNSLKNSIDEQYTNQAKKEPIRL